MTRLLAVADLFRLVLVPFILFSVAVLTVILTIVVVQHTVREVLFRRRGVLAARYRPWLEQLLVNDDGEARQRLESIPRRQRRFLSQLLVGQVRALEGIAVERARLLSTALGLPALWRRDLTDRRWWLRAEAARSLGVVADASCYDDLVTVLDDVHEEVRAAGIQALGRLGDPRAIGELVRRLPDEARQQRTRVIDSLCLLGAQGRDEVLAYTRTHPDALPAVWEVVGRTAGPSAMGDLLELARDHRADVRAAALGAVAAIGIDDRAYYHALRALTDEAPEVRAAAARALGRSHRSEAAEYLAGRLDDEWGVAAEAARGLARLGAPGRAALDVAAATRDEAHGGALARQVLWEWDQRVRVAGPAQGADEGAAR